MRQCHSRLLASRLANISTRLPVQTGDNILIGGFFAGESMFHRANDASKVALYWLLQHLRDSGFLLFDIQMLTPITTQLGGKTVTREEYLKRLAVAVERECVLR